MVTKMNKFSAILATVAIFFFAALSTAQAALDSSLDLYYEITYAQYNQDGSLFAADALANPWDVRVGDIITASVEWDSTKLTGAINDTLAYPNWQFSVTLGNGPLQQTIVGNNNIQELYFDFGELVDFFSVTTLPAHSLSVFAGIDFLDVDNIDFGGNSLAISSQLAPAPVPLPSALWLLGSGLVGMVGMRRKMKK